MKKNKILKCYLSKIRSKSTRIISCKNVSFKLKSLILSGLVFVTLNSCQKAEGPGGSSAITGNLSGRTYVYENNNEEQEVTSITIPNGNNIEDGEYFLLNTPEGGTLYYIWFKWDNGLAPEPNLSGRVGIQITYNFNQSNTTIAQNIADEILYVANENYELSVNNDIVTVTNIESGEVTDSEEFSQNITVDISNQGKNNSAGETTFVEGPIVDERVYLIYGNETFYSEDTRTDMNGNYQFRDLNRGNYTVFAYTWDTLNPENTPIIKSVKITIAEKREVVQAPNLFIYQ